MDNGAVKILSQAECLQIVRNTLKLNADTHIALLRYGVKRGSNELVGFMGEYYKLDIYIADERSEDGERKLHYFVKSVPLANEYHKAECENKGFFKKETRVYMTILPNIQRYAPSKLYAECYYTRDDLIVLEDLATSAECLRHLHADECYTMAHHKVVLRHLAKLHAAGLAWEAAEQFNIGERFQDILVETQLTMRNEWFVTGIKGIVFLAKLHEKFQAPKVQAFIDEQLYSILSKVEELTQPSKQLRNVLCHGDSWDRNIFYQYDEHGVPIDCRIVDFQLTRYSPPALDVLFFLYVNTSAEQRLKLYDDYLDFYHDTLQHYMRLMKLPENLISKQHFLLGCRRARLAILTLWAICEPLMKMPQGLAKKMRAEEQQQFDAYMNCERNEFFLRVMEIEPSYKQTIMQPIEELIDYLLENEELHQEQSDCTTSKE